MITSGVSTHFNNVNQDDNNIITGYVLPFRVQIIMDSLENNEIGYFLLFMTTTTKRRQQTAKHLQQQQQLQLQQQQQ